MYQRWNKNSVPLKQRLLETTPVTLDVATLLRRIVLITARSWALVAGALATTTLIFVVGFGRTERSETLSLAQYEQAQV